MTSNKRNYSALDMLCLSLDQALRAITGQKNPSTRPYPSAAINEAIVLSATEQKHAAGLMRVNHAGEIAAQALYHGQILSTSNVTLKKHLQTAAVEEGDHLNWCAQRLTELKSHTSYLNPVWYAGSFALGLVAGWAGDTWSLGFIVETEHQVVRHLQQHLDSLPIQDTKSAEILRQMQIDEAAHRDHAIEAGAKLLPPLIKTAMHWVSKVMVKTAYWV